MAQATLTRPRPWTFGRFPIRPPWLLLLLVVLAAAAAWAAWAWWVGSRQTLPGYQTAEVARGSLAVSISATGPISAPTSIPLNFKSGGKLAEVNVEVGQRVAPGQVLARLDAADLEAAVAQAQSTLDAAVASAATVADGLTAEEVAEARATLDAARVSVDGARKTLEATRAEAGPAISAVQADVESAHADLAGAQKALENSRQQFAAKVEADNGAIGNARLEYDNALKSYQAATEQAEKTLAANRVTVQNAEAGLKEAEASVKVDPGAGQPDAGRQSGGGRKRQGLAEGRRDRAACRAEDGRGRHRRRPASARRGTGRPADQPAAAAGYLREQHVGHVL
ncbi:MAG: biotin/lipoyl-binding protein [Chloroflexi bacterium]|nr:biotin/lipoyl-binding protein [Chloroflexota bacterium]